ncbi:unnamed protein product [Phytophthora fragariaefolia]|uniref:Unnamed protein product n=1 Tax=Phytophthora fragariaefolia TaxID=1490495 RepID=A0A9W6XE32_9STRA|nr:unnamed protein product [Phytophthora fragariaefolia]
MRCKNIVHSVKRRVLNTHQLLANEACSVILQHEYAVRDVGETRHCEHRVVILDNDLSGLHLVAEWCNKIVASLILLAKCDSTKNPQCLVCATPHEPRGWSERREGTNESSSRSGAEAMYNGIGLRTVRGSGTNGYVQRNLSYVNASRTRQTLARNQRGGSSGDFGAHRGGKSRPPPNADILLHEQKRKVELQLLEMSLEMEDRGCDPEEIQDKVKRERERLLARLNEAGERGRDKAKDVESSHARQKRKEEENKRIKDAFGIATDYVAGESFDPEMQERRRQERKEKREQEWKEREEARQQRLKERDEREEKMRARRERFRSPHSRSRSRARRSSSPAEHRSRDRRSRGRDELKTRRDSKSRSRSPMATRRSRRSSTVERKRRSVSSSSLGSSRSRSSGVSGASRSRSRSRKTHKGKRTVKTSAKMMGAKRSHSRSSSRSASSSESSSGSDSDRSRSPSRRHKGSRGKKTEGKVKKEKFSVSVSPARSAVLKGEHKVLNLSGRSASVSAVANDDSSRHEQSSKKEVKDSNASVKKEQDTAIDTKLKTKEEKMKQEPTPKSKAEKQDSLPRRRVFESLSQSASSAHALSLSVGILSEFPLTFAVGVVDFVTLALPFGLEAPSPQQPEETSPCGPSTSRLEDTNMTSNSPSRLETVHLLETELERQHVQAAVAAATATTGTNQETAPNVTNQELKSGELRPTVVLPTIFYTLLLGSALLASVLYRIFLIIRGEVVAQQKLGKKQYVGASNTGGLMLPSLSESAMDNRRSGRGTPPMSPTRRPIVDDSMSSVGRTATLGGANSSLSPKSTGEPSPQCYKRAPGSSPTIV